MPYLQKPEKPMEVEETTTRFLEIRIDRSAFKSGHDDLYTSLLQRYPQSYDLRAFKGVKDPIDKLQYGEQAIKIFNQWLVTGPSDKAANGKPARRIFDTLQRAMHIPDHEFGDCLIVNVSKGDAGFKCSFMQPKGSDSYVHHVAMAAMLCNGSVYPPAVWKKVSSTKSGDDNHLTISHLCGNGACVRPAHLLLEKKSVNDERTHCHFVLRHCLTQDQFCMVRGICPHWPHCFVNVYKINGAYY